MQYKTTKEIWDKIILSYEGDEQAKREKLQTLIIQYENLRMYNDESVANYFLRIDDIVNCMKNLGEEIKEAVVVEKVLRSLSSKFESKVSAIEEKENLQKITMSQLHGILTVYEMRKRGPSDRRESAFKASGKGDSYDSGHMLEEEEESNFVKNLQRGAGRSRGKLPFKCFACGRVSHYAAKCPLKGKLDKGKELVRWNRKQNVNKKSHYTHEDSDGFSNSDEDEQGNNYRLLMAFEDDDFMDAIDEEGLYEETSKLKICLEEKNMIINTLQFQLAESEKHHEKLECEIVRLRKEIEKTKALNLRFVKGYEMLDEIIKVQRSPLIKIGLGYNEEATRAQKPSTSKSILDAARRSEQRLNGDHQVNQGQFTSRVNKDYQVNRGQSTLRMSKSYNQPQVKPSEFASRMDVNRNYNHLVGNRRSFFNGQCFSCHKFGHKASQCVAYKTIMTREAQKQRNMTGIMKRTYNNFAALENEIEFSICNNFGHEDSECRRRFQQTTQKEQASSAKTWRMKEPQPERCGIALYAEGQENQWYIDSGCSKHMTGDKEKLQSYSSLEKEKKVSFGNDTLALIQGKTVIKGIRTPNNLYILKEGQQQCYLSKNDEHWLWHRRLGHLSFSKIRRACKYQAVRGLPDIRMLDNTI
eukprot:PITA_26172